MRPIRGKPFPAAFPSRGTRKLGALKPNLIWFFKKKKHSNTTKNFRRRPLKKIRLPPGSLCRPERAGLCLLLALDFLLLDVAVDPRPLRVLRNEVERRLQRVVGVRGVEGLDDPRAHVQVLGRVDGPPVRGLVPGQARAGAAVREDVLPLDGGKIIIHPLGGRKKKLSR
jgi:hypothetical protein